MSPKTPPNSDDSRSNPRRERKRPAKSNHVRATQACAYCRAKKLHCDENKPTCGNCGKKALLCAYEEVLKRRGKAVKPSPDGSTGEGSSASPSKDNGNASDVDADAD